MHLLIAPIYTITQKKNAKKKKKKKAKKKREKKPKRIFSRTKTHIFFKNDDAKKKKTKTKTQILGERCQFSSGEYCSLY